MISVDRDALLAVVRKVATVVEARNTIPILSNMLIAADGGTIGVTATNLDLLATSHGACGGEPARFTVPADKLQAALQSFGPGAISIDVAGGAAKLKQARSVRTIPTLPAEDYPLMSAKGTVVSFVIASTDLLRLLDCTAPAHSTEETRYYLCGTFLHATDTMLRGVATDGHRLIRAEVALPDGAAALPDIIVPTKAVTLVRKLLASHAGPVTVDVADGSIRFGFGDTLIHSKLIDGTYPDYQRIIPGEGGHRLTVARDLLLASTTAVQAVVEGEGKARVRGVRVTLGADGEQEMSTRDTTGASAIEPFAAAYVGKGGIEFGINGQYLRSILGIFADGADLIIDIESPASPLRITAAAEPDLVAVCMPLRV